MKPIAIFYHCLFFMGSPDKPAPRGGEVISGNMSALKASGLLDEASHVVYGINGGEESRVYSGCYLPEKGEKVYHGIESRSENATIQLLHSFALSFPGWNILYFHAKGACHTDQTYIAFLKRWVRCMTLHCIENWRTCVADLETVDSVGCHWMENVGVPPEDNIWGGNYWWATSEYLSKVPPISERELSKQYGVNSQEARYESERWLGSSGVKPTVKDYHLNGIGSCP